MTKEEWLKFGYEKGLISDYDLSECVVFSAVYRMWFKTKINTIKPQSVDRIDSTYRKYYSGSELDAMYIHLITEDVVIGFLNGCILCGHVSEKELSRIFQIVNNVLVYAAQLQLGYVRELRWDFIKRCLACENLSHGTRKEYIIPEADRQLLFRAVLDDNIYPEKQVQSVGVLLNFYLGCRVGELSSLKWQDVYLHEHYLYVHNTYVKYFERDETGARVGSIKYSNQDNCKTPHSIRKIPLIREAVFLLERMKELQLQHGYLSDYVFYNGSDVVMTSSIERCIKTLCRLCCINEFTNHSIRKTFASVLHLAGVPTKVICDLMGHTDFKTTERYYILNYEDNINYCRAMMQDCLVVKI